MDSGEDWNSKHQLDFMMNAAFDESIDYNKDINKKLDECKQKLKEFTAELKSITDDLSDAEEENKILLDKHKKWLREKSKIVEQIEKYKSLSSKLQTSKTDMAQRFSMDKFVLENKVKEQEKKIEKLERRMKLLLVAKAN
jgi:chromosome segregation ATPase